MGVESVASKRSCPPPESGNGSWSENSDKNSHSETGVGCESQVVEDGCLSRVHESRSAGLSIVSSVLVPKPAALVATVRSVVASAAPDPQTVFLFNNHILGDSRFHGAPLDNPSDRDSLPPKSFAFVAIIRRDVGSLVVPDLLSEVFLNNHKLGDSPSCNNVFDNLRDRDLLPPKPATFVAINHRVATLIVPDPSTVVLLDNHMLGDSPTCINFFDTQ